MVCRVGGRLSTFHTSYVTQCVELFLLLVAHHREEPRPSVQDVHSSRSLKSVSASTVELTISVAL